MQLQEDMNTVKYENIFQQAAMNITTTHHWYNNLMRDKLSPFDLTVQQYQVLRILHQQYPRPATINLIKIKMLDKMSDASRIVERLIQKGLVLKSNNLSDRRATDIHLSPAGQKLLLQVAKLPINEQFLAQRLTETEAEQLNLLLEKLRS
ncbi:DNA-binding MarR family transcriptional regulator [Pedobacter sp. CAN_A7]|uniref:MarR family winged helix-turn-helix transcriptional regulator n=1 Tax=Pedobacter sp. CAN_A7 TaxID=2787722 RepID=UPI0018C9052F